MQTVLKRLSWTRKNHFLLVLFTVSVVSTAHSPPNVVARDVANAQITLTTPTEAFPVLAMPGVGDHTDVKKYTTVARYRELANAGFTHNLTASPYSPDHAAKMLEVGKKTGIKQILSCQELLGEQAQATVRRFKDHPALAGYYLYDEPSAKDFAKVTARVKRIQAVDNRHPCYVNLFPNYASADQLGTATYQDYVNRFLREVPVPFLSFDNYPVVSGANRASLRADWYENLEIVAAAARRADKPFWAFVLSCPHGPYPLPTAAHLRIQAYSNLAYGAQVIQYFTYWTLDSEAFNFHDAPITIDGKRTVTYERVKQMNLEIQALRGVFLGAKVIRVGHTGKERPKGTRPYQPEAPIKKVTTGGQGAVVAHLSNGGRRFLVVVNRDINEPMPLAVELNREASVYRVEKDGSLRFDLNDDGRFEAHLEPGDVCILTWLDKAGK